MRSVLGISNLLALWLGLRDVVTLAPPSRWKTGRLGKPSEYEGVTDPMDQLFILRDATGSSAISTLSAARDARAAGREVAVLVTQAALAALHAGCFEWPRALSGPPMRIALATTGKALGLPVAGKGAAKSLDPKAMLSEVSQAGVPLLACPTWAALLGIQDALPEGLEAVSDEDVSKLLAGAGQIIGSL
jgi:peroxiredoxin family protein